MAWFYLFLAGSLEVVWSLGLKLTDGFTKPLASVVVVSAICASMWLLALASRTLNISTAYPIWVAIGIVGTTLGGHLIFGEKLGLGQLLFLGLLLTAIAGLKWQSAS